MAGLGFGLVRNTVTETALPVALALLLMPVSVFASFADELHIAAWNLEHLDDTDDEGCVGRYTSDYNAIAQGIESMDVDVVAFQEVENAEAAYRVFPKSEWHVEVSDRPSMGPGRACWDRPEARLGHLATGFAIRRGLAYRRNEDLAALGGESARQRWATDITIDVGDWELRMLSVHLASGCWGNREEQDAKRQKTCKTLYEQIEHLKAWADARRAEGTQFVILGDFNRRLALPGDRGWQNLSPANSPLFLLSEGVPFRCDPRFSAFIDHIVAGGGAEKTIVQGSFREWQSTRQHSDHCAVSARIRTDSRTQ